ncbi:hypothetical protein ACFZAS_41835, partial [Streptomyces lavendulae]
MSPTITVINQNDTPDTSSVPGRRMSLPGDPEDMLIDEACRELRLPAFRDRFIDLATSARREQGACPRVVDTSDPGPGRGRVGGIFYGDEGLLA